MCENNALSMCYFSMKNCRLDPRFSYLSKKKVVNMLLKPFKDEKEVVAVILQVSEGYRKVSGIANIHISGK